MLIEGMAFLLKGGLVMWPLFACAIASVAVMIERYFALRGLLRGSRGLADQVRSSLAAGRVRPAIAIVEAHPGPIAHVLKAAVENRGLGRQDLEHLITEVAMEETPGLSRGLGVLDTVITVAPLLGLLGTVTGMISAFQVVAVSTGLSAPTQITGGVAAALIATATGLAIAIATLVGYNYLTELVRRIVSEMEMAATQIINDLYLRGAAEERAYETAGV